MVRRAVIYLGAFLVAGYSAHTLAADFKLTDRNGDGAVEILAFGDSITYGVGDGSTPGDYVEQIYDAGDPRGYPLRLSSLIGVAVDNAGLPGEELIRTGIDRFPGLVIGGSADAVIIMEGVNDAGQQITASVYSNTLQRAINVARAENKDVVLATIAPPTEFHSSLAPFTNAYSVAVRRLAAINSLPLADIEQTFYQACPDLSICSYYNLPEGLHPNTLGYDAIAEAMALAVSGN